MITEEEYKEAKKLIKDYKKQQLNIPVVIVSLCRHKNCEKPTVDMDELWCKYHDLQING